MKVRDIMHTASKVSVDISVAKAAQLMDVKRTDSVLVEHKAGLGIFTERDILRKIVAKGLDPAKVMVSEIMSYPLITIDADGDVEEASTLMEEHDIRRLVVTENGVVVGVVSATCIARNVKYFVAKRLLASHFKPTAEDYAF